MSKPDWVSRGRECDNCAIRKIVLMQVLTNYKERTWKKDEWDFLKDKDKVDTMEEFQWWCKDCIDGLS